MRHRVKSILQYMPWLLLLLGMNGFSGLLLWLADARAFYAMAAMNLLATVLIFAVMCAVLVHRQGKKEQAFQAFLYEPDERREEVLLKTVNPAQREYIRLIGQVLRENRTAYEKLQTRLNDYEEYVESWAHETKAPLSLLTLLLDNRREELPAAVAFKLDHIRKRMQESVDQMLFYARVKGARKDYLFESIPIRACVEDVIEDYRPLLEERRFQVCVNLSDETVYSDRRGLYFLLGQIVSNSIKYCGGEPELWIEAEQTEDRYVMRVKDNGIGVRSCDLPYIFEKGFTGDSGEERKKATGMGLYLAKEIAGELNITLNGISQWGKGFEMRISFPVISSNPDN